MVKGTYLVLAMTGVCDIESLKSQGDLDWSSGMGEMLKYAVLDKSLDIEKIASRSDLGALLENIYQAISIKAKYVLADEFDKGQRQALNLGHTLGHAIEKLSDYKLIGWLGLGLGLSPSGRLLHRNLPGLLLGLHLGL